MPLQEFEFSWNKVANIQPQLEKLIGKNYFLNLSAKEAYKAYVRSYDSHSLKQIFDVNTLDLVSVAKSFGFQVPPFVDLPLSSGKTAGGGSSGSKFGGGGRMEPRGKGRTSGYGPPAQFNRKKAEKSVIYKAVPIRKGGGGGGGNERRQFSR